MKITKQESISYEVLRNGEEPKKITKTKGFEIDILGLAMIIILGIIAYELSLKGISVPFFVFYLVGLILVIYTAMTVLVLFSVFIPLIFSFRRELK